VSVCLVDGAGAGVLLLGRLPLWCVRRIGAEVSLNHLSLLCFG
jgi:hypothetical protein